jgi:hypothetical protein
MGIDSSSISKRRVKEKTKKSTKQQTKSFRPQEHFRLCKLVYKANQTSSETKRGKKKKFKKKKKTKKNKKEPRNKSNPQLFLLAPPPARLSPPVNFKLTGLW